MSIIGDGGNTIQVAAFEAKSRLTDGRSEGFVEGLFHVVQRNSVLWPFGASQAWNDGTQIQRKFLRIVEFWTVVGAE